jgi:hypothetical protein
MKQQEQVCDSDRSTDQLVREYEATIDLGNLTATLQFLDLLSPIELKRLTYVVSEAGRCGN